MNKDIITDQLPTIERMLEDKGIIFECRESEWKM